MPVELVFVVSAIGILGFVIKILSSGVVIYGDIAGLFYFVLINLFALLPFYMREYGGLEAEIMSILCLSLSVFLIYAFRSESNIYREF